MVVYICMVSLPDMVNIVILPEHFLRENFVIRAGCSNPSLTQTPTQSAHVTSLESEGDVWC